jgi:hypothetical protein
MITRTDSELGRLLLTERGMQLLHASTGDPHAVLLRAEDDDRIALGARMRELGPLYRSRTGAWVTADLELGRQILTDARLTSRTLVDMPELASPAGSYPPEPVGDLAVGGRFDLVDDVARPVLTGMVGEMLAVPQDKRALFEQLCRALAPALDAVPCPPRLPVARALIDAVDGLRALAPDGMLAAMVGIEVTVNVVANSMLALLDQPDEWRLLCADPARARHAVERTLLLDPPVRMECLVAQEDLTLAGQKVTTGSEVVVHIEAAQRGAAQHLSLTGGPPFGSIAPLVRTSAAAVLRALATRPTLRRVGIVVRRPRAPVTCGIVRFPVAD